MATPPTVAVPVGSAVPPPLSIGQLARELVLKPMLSQTMRLRGIAAALVVQNLGDGVIVLMIKSFIGALSDQSRAQIPLAELITVRGATYAAKWHWPAAVDRSQVAIIVPCVILLGGLTRAFANYLYQLHQQGLALYVAKQYRDRLFAALLALPYVDIRRRQVGEWMSVIMNDVMFLQSRFSDMLTGLVKDTVTVFWYFLVLSWIHWPSAVVLLVISPLIAFGMGRTGKRIARFAEAFQREMAQIAAAVLDLRSRFDFIRAQGGEEAERRHFGRLNLRYYGMIRRSILVRAAFAPMLEMLGFSLCAFAVYAVRRGYFGNLGSGEIFAFLGVLGLMMRPLREIGEQLSRFTESVGTLRNSLELFAQLRQGALPELPASAPRPSLPLRRDGMVISRLACGFAGVPRFVGEDLRLLPGRTVAVIGPSGAGKSTLLKTLAGLLEPLAWEANVPWRDLAGDVSMVSQEPFLFDDSVVANLVYGLPPEQQPDAAALHQALATVNIDREIAALPEGFDTRLRAIGANVSGGQLQRLVIARGLLRSKALWLLDEATSAVDARSEKDITLRLLKACRDSGGMLLAVTHRLSWLDSFDDVWFVEHGKVLWRGPHAELLKIPRYRDYCAAAAHEAVASSEPDAANELNNLNQLGPSEVLVPEGKTDGLTVT